MSVPETEPALRFMSAEMEYQAASQDRPGEELPIDILRRAIRKPFEGVASTLDPYSGNVNAFLTNGARFYKDLSSIEYAAPECLGITETATYVTAADYFVQKALFTALQKEIADGKSATQWSVHRRLVGYSQALEEVMSGRHTKGFHENYRVTLDDSSEYDNFRQRIDRIGYALVPFLIARMAFNGAGYIPDSGEIAMSQRALGIHSDIRAGATTGGANALLGKPWIIERDEPFDTSEHAIRLQICGDPNMCPWATWFTFGSTSVVLRLIESGKAPNMHIVNARNSSVQTALSSDPDKKTILIETDGHQSQESPMSILETYLETAEKYIDAGIFSQDELEFIPAWREAHEKMKHDPESLVGFVDWITKAYITSGITSVDRKRAREFRFDCIFTNAYGKEVPGTSGFSPTSTYQTGMVMRQRGILERVATQEELKRALTKPPETRAMHRSKIIWLIASLGLQDISSVGWNYCNVNGKRRHNSYSDFTLKLPRPDGKLSDKERRHLRTMQKKVRAEHVK